MTMKNFQRCLTIMLVVGTAQNYASNESTPSLQANTNKTTATRLHTSLPMATPTTTLFSKIVRTLSSINATVSVENKVDKRKQELTQRASLIVGVGFIPCAILLYLSCRFIPEFCSKIKARKMVKYTSMT